MTDAEKAALEAAIKWARTPDCWGHEHVEKQLKALADVGAALLAEPRLPAEPTREMLLAMATGWKVDPDDDYRGAYRALYAHLTAPKTKTVWHIVEAQDSGRSPEHMDYDSIEDALARVRVCAERHRITVTIEPREVPA